MGEPVWEGELDIANELNKEVTTSFPVDEALPNRKPGVYVLTAAAEGRPPRFLGIARHAMVRRLRHRPFHLYRPGRPQRLRPLARLGQADRRRRADAARQEQRDPRHRHDRRRGPRHLQPGPDPRRRRHGAGRADGQQRRQRLRLPRHDARRLRPVRPRRRRAAPRPARSTSMPGPSAASTAPARTCMSPPLPATTRPRRSRTCRSPSSSRAPTASRIAASSPTARRPAAMPSTWRCRPPPCAAPGRSSIHTDPEGAGGRQPDVPGRGLRSGSHRVRPDQRQDEIAAGEAAERHRRRPLPLWRAGGRPGARRRSHALDQARMGDASQAIPSASPTSRKAKRRASR